MTHDLSSGGGIGTHSLYIYINVLTMCSAPEASLTKWISDWSKWTGIEGCRFCGVNLPSSGCLNEAQKLAGEGGTSIETMKRSHNMPFNFYCTDAIWSWYFCIWERTPGRTLWKSIKIWFSKLVWDFFFFTNGHKCFHWGSWCLSSFLIRFSVT